MTKSSADICLIFSSEKEAEIFFSCIKPEEKSVKDETSETEIKLNKNKIIIKISAKNESRLRAIISSYNRFLRIYEDINNIGKQTLK